MNITALQNELSVKNKNGMAFLLSAVLIWTIITIVFLLPLPLQEKNIYALLSTGLVFPLAVLLSKIIQADWKSANNPLGDLGLYLNLAQLMYFPIIFWALTYSPAEMLMFFAIITGAHFFLMAGSTIQKLIISWLRPFPLSLCSSV